MSTGIRQVTEMCDPKPERAWGWGDIGEEFLNKPRNYQFHQQINILNL